MDRAELLDKIAREHLKNRFEESEENIRKMCMVHRVEIYQNFAGIMCDGFGECQERGKRIKYIIVSILESSILTQSYEMQIAFSDERMYLDEFPVYKYWKPPFIFSKVEEDICCLKKKASEKVARIKEYELAPIRKKYLFNHYFQVMLLLQWVLPDVFAHDAVQYSCLDEDTKVLYGKYMENAMVIYQSGGSS